MKAAKRFATALRIVGWVLLALAVTMSIYNVANDGAPWSSLKSALSNVEKNAGFVDRLQFDHQYFSALADAAASKGQAEDVRAARAAAFFKPWFDRLADGTEEKVQQEAEAFYATFQNGFDAAAYLEFYDQLESGEESRLLKDAFEYLDSVSKPAAGKGGKLAKLQAASVEPDIRAFYEGTFAPEHGEEAGEYLEFVESVVAMIKEDLVAGTAVTDAKQYVRAMDYSRYQTALAAVKTQEREAAEDVSDGFAQVARKLAAGEEADVRSYFEGVYEALAQRYPTESRTPKNVFLNTLWGLLNNAEFDGSMNTLMKNLRAVNEANAASSLEAATGRFSAGVVQTSDQHNTIGASVFLWFLAANAVWLWVLGVVLLILARVLDKVVSKVTLKHLENAGIEEDPDILLRVNHLKQYFRSGDYINKAVDDVSFYIKKGEVFGLVGESGCGKTTTGRTIINLYDPTEGDVYFQGLRISSTQNGLPVLIRSLKNEFKAAQTRMEADLKEKCAADPSQKEALTAAHRQKLAEMKREMHQKIRDAKTNALESSVEKSKCVEKYREKRKAELTAQYEKDMQGLSGTAAEERKARYEIDMKVAAKDNIMTKMQMIFQDPIASINPRMTVREIIAEGLKIRGIKDEKYIDEKVYEVLDLVGLVREHAARYPHEFSGGQRQRIGIARAIVLEPDLIIADEPISALDVSIQAQVINLLNDLRNKMGLTIMFIAHNLSVVKYFSDRIGVMYYGHLVELTTSDELFEHPLHPYTKSLLSAIPYPDPHHEKHRKRIEYDPHKAHDYSVDQPTLREIRPGHFIRCNNAEFEAYKKELGI